jgi:hypothetical protein
MKYIIIISLVIIFANLSYAQDSAEIREQESALANWRIKIQKAESLPPEQAIDILGRCVVKMTRKAIFQIDERWKVYHEAQIALISIPGHAEYYEKKIKAARLRYEEAKAEYDKGDGTTGIDEKAVTKSKLGNEQRYGFETLAQLPSVETVRVLGDFLSDDRGKFIPPPGLSETEIATLGQRWLESPSSFYAAQALNDLPLKTRPFPQKRYLGEDDVRPWLLWYQQIKEGRRTFSFEGDPQEYDLTGPVREARNPDVARVTKRPDVSSEASAARAGESSKHSTTPWVVGVLTMMAGIGVYVYLQNKRRS